MKFSDDRVVSAISGLLWHIDRRRIQVANVTNYASAHKGLRERQTGG